LIPGRILDYYGLSRSLFGKLAFIHKNCTLNSYSDEKSELPSETQNCMGGNKKMKKWMMLLAVFMLFAVLVTGCGKKTVAAGEEPKITPAAAEEQKVTPAAVEEPMVTPVTGSVESSEAIVPEAKVTYEKAKVYMTTDISAKGLMAVYEALERPAEGKTAIKLHFGEPGNKN